MSRQVVLFCLLGSVGFLSCMGCGLGRVFRLSPNPDTIEIEEEERGRVAQSTPMHRRETDARSLGSELALVSARGDLTAPALASDRGIVTEAYVEPVVVGVRGQSLVSDLMETETAQSLSNGSVGLTEAEVESLESTVQVNLPTVLSMVGPQHPAVGFARWRVQQAYAQLDQAKVLWLPTLRTGFGFHRHDGNLQASDGKIIDVNRNSFQYGLGVGAVGAGTTPSPGLIAEFHFADAIFQPRIAGRNATARSHGSQAVLNERMMNAALAYLDLLAAHQDLRIMEEIRERTTGLSKLTGDFASSGAGLQADADRMLTELALAENRVLAAREQVGVTEARLTQAISADTSCEWLPMDVTVLPLQVVDWQADRASTIQVGLANRPELREAQSLVAAACERYQREKYSPFVPSVLLGFSNGGFGGGLGNNLDNVDGRYDFDALVAWELRNSGFGEHAARRETSSQVQMAKFEKIRMMDQVAREVSEAHTQVQYRSQQVTTAQKAIQNALDSYERNLSRIRDGQGLPLESLQSLRALEEAQRTYLRAVTDYNQAQFRLQWAMGWPITSPTESSASPVLQSEDSL